MAKKVKQVEQSPFQRMEEYLGYNYKFVYNVVLNKVANINAVTQELEYVDDVYFNTIWTELLRSRMDITRQMLKAYLNSHLSAQFDPFQSYFEELEAWHPDQPDYIQLLADTITVPMANRELWNMYLRRWLIATVGCAVDAKTINQQVLVLVGEQGTGKTKWTDKLVPDSLREYYYSGDINPGDKDSNINVSECFIINLDELGNLNRGNLNRLKQIITLSSIRLRRPYGDFPEAMPRRASFVGSVNGTEFLRDETGNRRYLCMECTTIDYNHQVPMDRVYAQALYLFNREEKYWFDGAEIGIINSHNQQYKVQYSEMEHVNEHFEACDQDDKDMLLMKTTDIQRYLKKYGGNLSDKGLGVALRASNYKRVRRNGGTRFYVLKYKTSTTGGHKQE